MTQEVLILLLAPAQDPVAEPTSSIERIIAVLAPIALAVLALFNKNIRTKITGSNEPDEAIGSGTTPTEAATRAFTASVDFQHTLIVELQDRAKRGENRVQQLETKLEASEDEVGRLQVEVARLEGQVINLQNEVNRLRAGGGTWR